MASILPHHLADVLTDLDPADDDTRAAVVAAGEDHSFKWSSGCAAPVDDREGATGSAATALACSTRTPAVTVPAAAATPPATGLTPAGTDRPQPPARQIAQQTSLRPGVDMPSATRHSHDGT